MKSHEQVAGELTRYALGELNPMERAELERHVASCGDCQSDLQRLQGDLALLALASPRVAPPPRARARLLAAIGREPRMAPAIAPAIGRPGPLRALWWMWTPSAAAFALAIVVGLLWHDNADLRRETRDLASMVANIQLDAQNSKELLTVLTAPDAMHITLIETGSRPQPHGKATYAPLKGTLVFVASNLGQLPPRKAYQLWLVATPGGKPIPAGTFKPDLRGSAMVMHQTAPRLKPKRFAVTIEAEEGTESPTTPMVMVGDGG
jgi:anti-sigma-K factor RskA